MDKLNAFGWVSVALAVAVQPLLSMTFTVYVPVESPPAVAVVCEFASLQE